MEDIILSLIFLVLYTLCIYYCYKVANRLRTNKVVAIVVGIVIPFGGALIYNHLSYRHKNGTVPHKGIFK